MNSLQIFERNWILRKHYHSHNQPKIKATQYNFLGWRHIIFIFDVEGDVIRGIEGVQDTDVVFSGFYGGFSKVEVHIDEKIGHSYYSGTRTRNIFKDHLYVPHHDLIKMINSSGIESVVDLYTQYDALDRI